MVFYTLYEGGVALPARRLALGFSLVTTDDEIKSRSAVVGLRGRQLAFFASAIVWALQRDSAVPHVRPYVLMWVEQAERCVVVGWGGGCGVGTQATPSGRCVRTRLSRATRHDSSRAPLHLWCRPYLVDGEWLSLTDAVPSHTSDGGGGVVVVVVVVVVLVRPLSGRLASLLLLPPHSISDSVIVVHSNSHAVGRVHAALPPRLVVLVRRRDAAPRIAHQAQTRPTRVGRQEDDDGLHAAPRASPTYLCAL